MPYELEIEDHEKRFLTYLNYVTALSNFLKMEIGPNRYVFENIVNSRSFRGIQGGQCMQPQQVCRLLRNAWLTEIQLGLPSRYTELVSYSNHWAPVQLYYSIYLAIRAFFLAGNRNVREDHTTTLRTISRDVFSRPELFPFPWKILCTGDPSRGNIEYLNLSEPIQIQPVSSLTSGEHVDYWGSYGLFLKTTRDRQIDKSIKDWKKSKRRKTIRARERAEVVGRLSPTSFFHCVYRLRIRSNYSDVESFLVSIERADDSGKFNGSLRRICWYTLFVLELLIARYVGRRVFGQWVEEFIRYDSSELGTRLAQRRCRHISQFLQGC